MPEILNVMNYVGEKWVPRDIRRRRSFNLETMRRLGTPVVIKKKYNDHDVKEGRARKAPTMASAYGQPRRDDPITFGVGFMSIEDSVNDWYNLRTTEYLANPSTPPTGTDWIKAPLHRGYGPSYLTYVIEPDVAEDEFRLNEAGALIRAQDATAQAPWYPEMNDNDLLINVIIDRNHNIIETKERYELKMVNPTSMRGHQRMGRREYTEDGGNRFVIGQTFEMTLLPQTDILYEVPL